MATIMTVENLETSTYSFTVVAQTPLGRCGNSSGSITLSMSLLAPPNTRSTHKTLTYRIWHLWNSIIFFIQLRASMFKQLVRTHPTTFGSSSSPPCSSPSWPSCAADTGQGQLQRVAVAEFFPRDFFIVSFFLHAQQYQRGDVSCHPSASVDGQVADNSGRFWQRSLDVILIWSYYFPLVKCPCVFRKVLINKTYHYDRILDCTRSLYPLL